MGGHIHPRITDSFEIVSCYANGRRGIFVLILHSQKNCIDRINHVRRISISSMVDRLPKPQFQRQLATSFQTTKKRKEKENHVLLPIPTLPSYQMLLQRIVFSIHLPLPISCISSGSACTKEYQQCLLQSFIRFLSTLPASIHVSRVSERAIRASRFPRQPIVSV
jgi:hypothetical protein